MINRHHYRSHIYKALRAAPPESWSEVEWRAVHELLDSFARRRRPRRPVDNGSTSGAFRALRASISAVPTHTWSTEDVNLVLGSVEQIRLSRSSKVIPMRRGRRRG